jgi:hypothetical protein
VIPPPTECPCCGGNLAKLGETITETLESLPLKGDPDGAGEVLLPLVREDHPATDAVPPCSLRRRLVATSYKLARRASSLGATTVHLVP